MVLRWSDGVSQVYRQSSSGGNGDGGRFYMYTDKYGGEWLYGKPNASSRFGMHNLRNGNSIFFW